MGILHLKIITPSKLVREEEVSSVTVPTAEGEITVLPRHTRLATTLADGIVTLRKNAHEDSLAIGGGFLETDGTTVTVLVSRAHGQDEIDEAYTKQALEQAQKDMREKRDAVTREEALTIVRRSLVDLKLLKKKTKRRLPETQSM